RVRRRALDRGGRGRQRPRPEADAGSGKRRGHRQGPRLTTAGAGTKGAFGRPFFHAWARLALFGVAEIRFDAAVDLHGHRVAAAVQRAAHGDPDPAFAHAVLLDVRPLLAVEADADAAAERGLVVMRAAGIVAEAVGRGL